MRSADVYYQDLLAGLLTETDDGEYSFIYNPDYVKRYPNKFITFTMPVRNEIYLDKRLFPFF